MTDRELLELAAKATGYELFRVGASMTDRELLELAAEAAGMSYWVHYYEDRTDLLVPDGEESAREWNPLTDDGDALRLAVKLEIEIIQGDGEVAAHPFYEKRLFIEPLGDDAYAATRRAIVRAAAEIGMAMP